MSGNLPAHVAYRRPANRPAGYVIDLTPVPEIEYRRVRMHHGPTLTHILYLFLGGLWVAFLLGLLLWAVT